MGTGLVCIRLEVAYDFGKIQESSQNTCASVTPGKQGMWVEQSVLYIYYWIIIGKSANYASKNKMYIKCGCEN